MKSNEYLDLVHKEQTAPIYDPNLDFQLFRANDYNYYLDLFESKMASLTKLDESISCKIKRGIQEDKVELYDYRTHSELWNIVLKTGIKTKATTITIPLLDQYKDDQNYLILNGKHYTPLVTMGLGTINVLDKTTSMTIMLHPDFMLSIRGEFIKFTGGARIKTTVFVDQLALYNSGGDVDNKLLYDMLKIKYDDTKHEPFFDWLSEWVYFDNFKKMNSHFYHLLTNEVPANDPIALLYDIIVNIPPTRHINYGDFTQRRLVFGEFLTSSLWNYYRTVVFNHMRESNYVPSLKKNTMIADNFHNKMHRGLMYNNASPTGYSVLKVSQKQPGTSSDVIMPTEWIQCNPSAFKLTCPTSVSAASMGKNLYLTPGTQVNDLGIFYISQKSELMAAQLGRIPFMSTVDPSRSNMQTKYTTQAVTSGKQQRPYTEQYETYNKTIFNDYATGNGIVVDNNGALMKIRYDDNTTQIVQLVAWKSTDSVNGVSLKDSLQKDSKFTKGDRLTTYVYEGEFVHRARVAYMSFLGYTPEDAHIMSESFAKRMTIDYGHSTMVPITANTIIHDIAAVGQIFDDEPVIVYDETSRSMAGLVTDVKYHGYGDVDEIVNDMTKTQIKYLVNSIYNGFGDTSLTEEDIKTHYCSLEDKTLLQQSRILNICSDYGVEITDLIGLVEIITIDTQVTGIADKSCGLYANKGVGALILPDIYMPIDQSTNIPIDIVFNPMGVPRRNNHGLILEGFIGKLIDTIERQPDHTVQQNMLKFVRDNLLKLSADYRQYDEWMDELPVVVQGELQLHFLAHEDDVNFVTVNKFMNQFDNQFEEHIDIGVNQMNSILIKSETYEYLRDTYKYPFGGFTLEDTTVECQILNHSWLKLHHTAHSKHVAAGFIVNKNQSTGLNAKGRAVNGSSSLSWMSSYAYLMAKNSQDGKLTSLPGIYENFVLKSDLVQSDQAKFGKDIIGQGSDYVFQKEMLPSEPKTSLPLTYVGAHLQYINVSIEADSKSSGLELAKYI